MGIIAFEMSNVELYVSMAIGGIFTGIGITIGTYIANNHLIKKTENSFKKLKNRLKRKKNV